MNLCDGGVDQVCVEIRYFARVTNICSACGDNNVRGRQCVATKYQAVRNQSITDGTGSDRLAIVHHQAATTQADRLNVRHAEIRPYAAHFDRNIRLTRKAILQYADIRGRAADVDHYRVIKIRQQAGAAQRIRRTGRKSQRREFGRKTG